MATYNIEKTSKADRNFTTDLDQRLIESHRRFNPNDDPSSIKVMSHNSGFSLHTGSGGDSLNYRYIRVIIDITAGSKTADEKQGLMRRTMECCMEYEGKKAQDCEFEIRINEVEESNVMRTLPGRG